MGTVETRSKTPDGECSDFPKQDKRRDTQENKKLKEAIQGLDGGHGGSNISIGVPQENGIRVSIRGKKDDDGGGGGDVAVVKAKVVDTKISVDPHGLADSEMKGISSLLTMRGSAREVEISHGGGSETSEKLDSVFGFDKITATADNSGGGNISLLAASIPGGTFEAGKDKRNDLAQKNEVEENANSVSENGEDLDEKIVTIDVPIMETSENMGEEVGDITGKGYCFSVGDFVWGKIKSHPWWPGRIYDPSDASDHAAKLRLKNQLLVVYFGDGTFAWCHPSQLKSFKKNFEEMAKQSSSKSFVNAVKDAIDEVGRLIDLKMTCPCIAKENWDELGWPLAKNSGIKKGVLVPETGLGKLSHIIFDNTVLLSRVKQIAEITATSSVLELEILKGYLSAFYRSKGIYQLPIYKLAQPIPGLEDNSTDEVMDITNGNHAMEVLAQGPCEEDFFSLPGSPKFGETGKTILQISPRITEDGKHHRRKQKSIAEIMGKDKDTQPKSKEGSLAEELRSTHKLTSSGKKKRKGSEEANGLGGDRMTPKLGRRTKKELLGSPSSSLSNVSSAEGDGSVDQEDTGKLQSLKAKKKKKNIGSETSSNGGKLVTDGVTVSTEGNLNSLGLQSKDEEDKEQTEKGYLGRERKRSKYLSPPFTSINRGQRKRDTETESLKVVSEARLSEKMSRATSHLLGLSPSIPEDEYKFIDPVKVKASPAEVLSEVRSAAVDPSEIPEIVGVFLLVFRSSMYSDGPHYKVYNKPQPGRKRKNAEFKLGSLKKNQNQTNDKSSNHESEQRKRRRNKKENPEMPKQQQAAYSKTSNKGTDEDSSSAALFLTFGPGSCLPSKANLITLYSKFGPLNETETDMFYNNFVARVSFMRSSDAEEAYNQSQNSNPFGSLNVTFRLQYLSDESRTCELNEVPHSETSHLPKAGYNAPKKPSNSEASQLNFIRQKLQIMTLMLEAADDKALPDMKKVLEGEMKGLLEKVNKMIESSSS
ncbi:Serine/threonine-protein kinase ATM [Quillaja saponaria]|uniref:Serine/threonine-protein kinase ATM n=1 Tax=Quillaja saponaria TaxID=32244 RepID=A0AAD7Q4D8_QUISA|nr:Serine/threonine-protein kinase ATM [Quillaja saponaria]